MSLPGAARALSEIRLHPNGQPRWDNGPDEPGAEFVSLREAFASDWREGVFTLAADKTDTLAHPTLRYWQGLGESLLTRLCHLPADHWPADAPPPPEDEIQALVWAAPPMTGGEYLTAEVMAGLWRDLVEWSDSRARAEGGLGVWLEKRAPRWRQVGRVCFHLAENKANPELPFAFMATFVSGLGATGRTKHLPLGNALQQFQGNRAGLIKLLSPVSAAAERLAWVKGLVDRGEVYRAVGWAPEQAHRMLLDAQALEECGLALRLPDWWRKRTRAAVVVKLGQTSKVTVGVNDLVDFDVGLALGDETLTQSEAKALLAGGADGLVLIKGQWVEVNREKLKEALSHWESVRKAAGKDGVSFIEGMRMLAGASARLDDAEAVEERTWSRVEAGAALQEQLNALRERAASGVDFGKLVQATLRPYQLQGVDWLRMVTEMGLGACLADDMGLGKTLQVLTLLSWLRESGRAGAAPALLVAPASLLGNWRAEAARFAPSLRLAFLHPSESEPAALERIAKNPARELKGIDLAVTTYAMAARQNWLAKVEWDLVILDEAQAIKNPSTKQARSVKTLPARARIAMTGTPVENRLGDLWSLFDFINPGLLGSAAVFKKFVGRLEARPSQPYAPLRRLIAPYILRRLKTDRAIIDDLPEKTEQVAFCHLTREQVRLYGQVVDSMKAALENVDGMKRRALALQTLMRLKQICNHPSQLLDDGRYDPAHSGKFHRLEELCEEIASRQERVLVFTQFREMIDPLAGMLARVFGRGGLTMHGEVAVAQRRKLVEQFQSPDGPPFLALTLKVGGAGLNLTAASHVIHFDRWWNPAVEDQATDRAFRIGQKRNVLVHKFVTQGTLEERIHEMIMEKRALSDEILSKGAEVDITSLSDRELINLVSLDVTRAME